MWTQDALVSNARSYRQPVWRIVESQHTAATKRITDTDAEQELLETILEETKPAIPPECVGLPYLLSTPFRYSPYPHGSRFRRANQREGAFYAAEKLSTALAETAFYKLLFLAESPEMQEPRQDVGHTAFAVLCNADRLLDLTQPPLDRDRTLWTEPVNYAACQDLADMARQSSVQVFRYESVRDPKHLRNIAILAPAAFGDKTTADMHDWRFLAKRTVVRAWTSQQAFEFSRAMFQIDPRLE